jgi:hypothetical protein
MTESINKLEGSANQQSEPFAPQRTLAAAPAHSGVLDLAEDLTRPLHGWPQVAKLVSEVPQFEAYQTFRDLHVKSLLYYQAELVSLRKELHAVEYEDARSSRSEFAENLDFLFASGSNEDPNLRRQWTLITKIRKVLKEYGMLDSASLVNGF